jgi:hypothetical protein
MAKADPLKNALRGKSDVASVPFQFCQPRLNTSGGLEAFACSSHVLRRAGAADPKINRDYVFL